VKLALALAGVLVFGAAAVARAADVRLQMDDCALAPVDEVRRILNIELRGALVETAEATNVTVSCADASAVRVTARDTATDRALERTVALGAAAPSARSRLLALSIAELVLTLEREREATPPPTPTPPPPSPPPPAPIAAPPSQKSRLQLSAFASGQGLFAGTGFLAGGGLRIAQDFPQHIGWSTDAFAEHGSASSSIGAVAIDVLSVDATLFYSKHWRRIGIRAGAGARGGAVRLDGSPAAGAAHGGTVWGPWGGPLGRLSAVVTPWRRLVFELAVDGGYVLVPVAGFVDGQRQVAVDGGWVGFSVAVGAFL
jgi:hypothetical protein